MTVQDLLLKHVCPHRVLREWLAISSDRKFLLPSATMSSKDVQVYAQGVEVPKDGLGSRPRLTGSKRGPFEITAANQTFRFTLEDGVLQSVTLPLGPAVSPEIVAKAIARDSYGIETDVTASGSLVVENPKQGQQASITLQGGTAHATLGLPDLRFYRGALVYPAWEIVKRPSSVDSKMIQFETPVPSTEDIWEVSYTTSRSDCRRCSGLGIENDIRLNARGDAVMVSGSSLLAQEAEKAVFTILGSNVFYSWYGTRITDVIGSKVLGAQGSYVASQIQNEVRSVLEKLRDVKQQQAVIQPVDDQEYFDKIGAINVFQDVDDPTVFHVQVEVINGAQEVAEIRQSIAVQDQFVG